MVHTGGAHGDSDGFIGEDADVGLGKVFEWNTTYFDSQKENSYGDKENDSGFVVTPAGKEDYTEEWQYKTKSAFTYNAKVTSLDGKWDF